MTNVPQHLRNKLKAKCDASSTSSIEVVRKFLRRYWGDESDLDLIRTDILKTISLNPSSVKKGIQSIEALLKAPPEEGVLLEMVLWDANHPLDDPSEESARHWLRETLEFTRQVLEEHQ